MSKITRKTQLGFGTTAGTNQLVQYGSFAAGTPVYSSDPATMQALDNFLTGWFGGVVGSESPCIEDMNTLFYLAFYQLRYLFQAGVPEWDSATAYYIGSKVNVAGKTYTSLTDSNTNNNPSTDTLGTNWYSSDHGQIPLGAVIATFPNLTGAFTTTATTTPDPATGFVLCQGQTLASGPMSGQVVPNINNSVFLRGSTTSGGTGGASTVSLASGNIPGHTHTFTSSTSVASSSHTHNFSHDHIWSTQSSSNNKTLASSNTASTDCSSGSIYSTDTGVIVDNTGSSVSVVGHPVSPLTGSRYTSGVADNANSGTGSSASTGSASASTTVSGTTDSTGSGTAFSIIPPYINTVYVMRVA